MANRAIFPSIQQKHRKRALYFTRATAQLKKIIETSEAKYRPGTSERVCNVLSVIYIKIFALNDYSQEIVIYLPTNASWHFSTII